MTPDEYCQQTAAASGSSFYYSFLFLPAEQRRAITALYAFCREVDDIVDEVSEASVARMKLTWWRGQVEQIFNDGKPDHPVAIALTKYKDQFNFRAEPFFAVIEGMEMDLDKFSYANWAELKEYCWRAAGVVGDLSASIFGYSDPKTLEYAETLGLAFQMTNIIRDVGEDARRGRIYIPAEDMDAHGVSKDDILDSNYNQAFQNLMQAQTDRARGLYRQAMQLLPEQDRRKQRAGLMMAAIYYTLLDEMERDKWHVLNQRIALTPIRKFWLAWKVWVGGGNSLIKKLAA